MFIPLKYNPIIQDIKDGKLRYYQYGDMLFNYGAFPQTWEDPNIICKYTKKKSCKQIYIII